MRNVYTLNNQAVNEEQRLKQLIQQKRTEGNQTIQNQEDEQQKDLIETAERYKKEKERMEKSFEVSLSEEGKRHSERLAAVRESHKKEIEETKKNNEKEMALEEQRAERKLASFMQKQEEVISKLHARYHQAQEELRKNNGDL